MLYFYLKKKLRFEINLRETHKYETNKNGPQILLVRNQNCIETYNCKNVEIYSDKDVLTAITRLLFGSRKAA